MLREILNRLRAKSPLSDMLGEFVQMLEKTEWMFDTSVAVLMAEKPADEVKDEVYAKDKEVNEHQRSIRRKVVSHLSIQPGADIPICLVLMSVVKDVERIGDYSKNIFEVGTTLNVIFDQGRYKTPLKELVGQVKGLFGTTRRAFADSDYAMARTVMDKGKATQKQCDLLLKQLLLDDIPTRKAVGYTLLSRYIKRVSSHLTNVATSVVTPVDRLDYLDEDEPS